MPNAPSPDATAASTLTAESRGLLRVGLLGLALIFSGCSTSESTDPIEGVSPGADLEAPEPGDDADAATEPETDSEDGDEADPEPEGPLTAVQDDPNFAVAAAGWLRGDLHYHTTHSGDAANQGGDDLATCLAIADWYRHPTFEQHLPELAGNGLDYIAITDHRTDAVLSDEDFVHEHLILIPGEEYGGGGHAGIFGITEHVPHDPLSGESQNERHLDAIDEAHGMGAVFSVNHPVQGNNWNWDTPTIDGVEIWNGPWSSFYIGTTAEELEEDIASTGAENPYIWDAMESVSAGHNDRALRFWQGHLTGGLHPAVIGGSDRHMVVPAALPTTYVRRAEGLDGPEGVLQGIRDGGTFVSRSPFGPQIDLSAVDEDGKTYPLGAALPHAGPWQIEARVSRAVGGVLRLIAGPMKPADADGRVRAEPEILFEAPIHHALVEGTFAWTAPAGGGWIHAVVLEPVAPNVLDPELAKALATFSTPASGNALVVMAEQILPLVDEDVVLTPENCDPADWLPDRPQCVPVDQMSLATFQIPDALERLLHIAYEDGVATDRCMGAISSAFLFRPE